jgi:8-oxo-dGTP pyrophosphatase MutT (NUDIX family)
MNAPVPKAVSIVFFYEPGGLTLIQDRREISKWGEDYGLFGGTREPGETPKQTAKRELKEELGLTNVPLEHYRTYTHNNPDLGIKVKRSVYLSRIPVFQECNEGSPVVMPIQDTLELKMIPGFTELIGEIRNYLVSEGRIPR